MEKCKFCGAEVPDGSNFCVECGKPVSQGNVCPHCGAPISDGDIFCQECGKRIDEKLSSAEPIQGQCPQCGADVSDGDAFCQNCGHRLIPNEESSDSTGYEDGNEETIGEVVNTSKSKFTMPIILGIIVLALLGGWYFLGTSSDTTNGTEVKDSISTGMATVDTDTLGINEDIGDVHSEAYIKHRLQQICAEIPSTPAEVLVNKYFAESFKELYNAVIKEDQIETQRGNIGFFDCDFWTGGRHGELKSVTILDLTNITELSALATVQDLIMFNEDNESKNSKDVHLVFENEDWYINDLSDYSGSRMSKRMQEYLEADDEIKSQEELAKTNTAIGAFDVKGEENDSIQ